VNGADREALANLAARSGNAAMAAHTDHIARIARPNEKADHGMPLQTAGVQLDLGNNGRDRGDGSDEEYRQF